MSETLEAIARALFKSWFVDFDPVRAKAEGRDPGLPKHIADLFSSLPRRLRTRRNPGGWEVGSSVRLPSTRAGVCNPTRSAPSPTSRSNTCRSAALPCLTGTPPKDLKATSSRSGRERFSSGSSGLIFTRSVLRRSMAFAQLTLLLWSQGQTWFGFVLDMYRVMNSSSTQTLARLAQRCHGPVGLTWPATNRASTRTRSRGIQQVGAAVG